MNSSVDESHFVSKETCLIRCEERRAEIYDRINDFEDKVDDELKVHKDKVDEKLTDFEIKLEKRDKKFYSAIDKLEDSINIFRNIFIVGLLELTAGLIFILMAKGG